MATMDDAEVSPTPLQMKMNVMAEQITYFGCAAALILLIMLFAKFLFELKTNPDTPAPKAQDFLQIVIVTVTVIVIARLPFSSSSNAVELIAIDCKSRSLTSGERNRESSFKTTA